MKSHTTNLNDEEKMYGAVLASLFVVTVNQSRERIQKLEKELEECKEELERCRKETKN